MSRRSEPPSTRIFRCLSRMVLPAAFRREFGEPLLDAFRDRLRSSRGHGASNMTRVWMHELSGLVRMGWNERVSVIRQWYGTRTRASSTRKSTGGRNMMNSLKQDVAYGVRMILKTPILSAIAIISLAVGVAVNTTVFSLLHSWLLRPLPYDGADRLVMLFENDLTRSSTTDPVAPANYFDWVERATAFEAFLASRFEPANMTGIEGPQRITTSLVTPNFFEELGTQPLLGRTFTPNDGGAEDAPVAVLSERLWKNRFGGDPQTIGRTVTLDGATHTIVGIVPEQFGFILGTVNLWIATNFRELRADRTNKTLTVTAKLRKGVEDAQAQAELTAIAQRLETLYPDTNEDTSVNLLTLREQFPGPTDRGLVTIVMVVVLLVLLVACTNVASLLMAKTETRQKEMALRLALGAGKRRIVRQLLTESVVMALVGGALGMVLSVWGIRALVGAIPDEMPGLFLPTFNGQVALFGAALSILAGLTFGVTPATQAIANDLRSPLLEGSRGGTAGKKKKRIRQAFVTVEFAVALAVLVGAAVLTDLFQRRLDVELGFRSENILTMALRLPEHRYATDESIRRFTDELERGVGTISGATDAAIASVLPRTRSITRSMFTIDGTSVDPSRAPNTTWLTVNPDYFETLDIAVMQGRRFTNADRADGSPVVIVNERFVELHFPEGDPVGRRITIAGASREIVGVAANIAQRRLTGLEPDLASVYFPIAQHPVRQLRLILHAQVDPKLLATPVQNVVWSIDPDQPVSDVMTLGEHMDAALAGPTTMSRLLFIVGALALSLAVIGIYGVMAYTVARQTSEIGIRMALGAKPRQVVSSVTRQGATLTGFGLILGIPLAGAVTAGIAHIMGRGISSDGLGQIETISIQPLVTIGGVLIGAGLLAAYLPALRATRIDPASALQEE